MAAKKKAKVKKPSVAQRAKTDPGLLARALRDPGLRSKLPSSMLTPQLREARRLNTPVLPGSSLTNRDVERQVGAATDLQFGPNAVALQQQRNRDTADWYAQYQRDLQQHAANVGQIGQQAAGQVAGLSQGIRGLGDQALTEQQQREAQNARVTGAQPDGAAQTASDASAVRQAMVAALGSAEAGRGAARSSYADALANVVAPGQRLQAQAAGQSSLRDLEGKIGAFKAAKTGDLVDAERKALIAAATEQQKNALALQIAGINADTKTTTASITAQQRAADRAAQNANAAASRAVTKRGQDLSHQDRQASSRSKKGKSPWLGQASQNTAKDKIDGAVSSIKNLKDSYSQEEVRKLLLNGRAAQTVDSNGKKVKIPAISRVDKRWVNVAMDIIYRGYISQANIQALHNAGIKVNQLGYPTKPGKATAKPQTGIVTGAVDAVQGAIDAATGSPRASLTQASLGYASRKPPRRRPRPVPSNHPPVKPKSKGEALMNQQHPTRFA